MAPWVMAARNSVVLQCDMIPVQQTKAAPVFVESACVCIPHGQFITDERGGKWKLQSLLFP